MRYVRVVAVLACFLVSGVLPHPPGPPVPVVLAGEQPSGEDAGHEAEMASVAVRPGRNSHGVSSTPDAQPATPHHFLARSTARSHTVRPGLRPALFHFRC